MKRSLGLRGLLTLALTLVGCAAAPTDDGAVALELDQLEDKSDSEKSAEDLAFVDPSESVLRKRLGSGGSDVPMPVAVEVPDGWAAEVRETPVGSIEWVIGRDGNEAVERAIAKDGGMEEESLYNPSGAMSTEAVGALIESDRTTELGHVRLVVTDLEDLPDAPKSWDDADDLREWFATRYVNTIDDPVPVTVAGLDGLRYDDMMFLSSTSYHLRLSDHEHLFVNVFPRDSIHLEDIAAMLETITPAT